MESMETVNEGKRVELPESQSAPVHRFVRPISRDQIGRVLQAAYESEINVSLSWFWDAGVEAKVFTTDSAGEQWRFSELFYNDGHNAVCDATRWIVGVILKNDPTSEFSRRWNSGELC